MTRAKEKNRRTSVSRGKREGTLLPDSHAGKSEVLQNREGLHTSSNRTTVLKERGEKKKT